MHRRNRRASAYRVGQKRLTLRRSASGQPVFANGAVTAAFAEGFNDEAHVSAGIISYPKPVEYLAKALGVDLPTFNFRASVSFPLFNEESKFNFGLSVDRVHTESEFLLGSIAAQVGYNYDSSNISYPNSADVANINVLLGPTTRNIGVGYQLNSSGQTSGVNLLFGEGYTTSLTTSKSILNYRYSK